MNRTEAIEYFKTVSEERSKAFYDAIQYCNANEDDVREFEETSKAYDMAIKSLQAWDEVLAWLETLESITAKLICRYIKTTLREVEDD